MRHHTGSAHGGLLGHRREVAGDLDGRDSACGFSRWLVMMPDSNASSAATAARWNKFKLLLLLSASVRGSEDWWSCGFCCFLPPPQRIGEAMGATGSGTQRGAPTASHGEAHVGARD